MQRVWEHYARYPSNWCTNNLWPLLASQSVRNCLLWQQHNQQSLTLFSDVVPHSLDMVSLKLLPILWLFPIYRWLSRILYNWIYNIFTTLYKMFFSRLLNLIIICCSDVTLKVAFVGSESTSRFGFWHHFHVLSNLVQGVRVQEQM